LLELNDKHPPHIRSRGEPLHAQAVIAFAGRPDGSLARGKKPGDAHAATSLVSGYTDHEINTDLGHQPGAVHGTRAIIVLLTVLSESTAVLCR
jgi:hypothetical protein